MSQAELMQQAPANNLHMFRALVGIGILCALLIVVTYENTLPVIKQNRAEALQKAVFKVLPGATKKVNFKVTDNGFEAFEGDAGNAVLVYAGFNDDEKLVGIAIEANGQGFQDVLNILYGYAPESQAVIGFYVLESRETPGLGDKIEKDPRFLSNFEALDVSLDASGDKLLNSVEAVKNGSKTKAWQVDCITGATISSKAIVKIINSSSQGIIPKIYQNKNQFVKE